MVEVVVCKGGVEVVVEWVGGCCYGHYGCRASFVRGGLLGKVVFVDGDVEDSTDVTWGLWRWRL